MKAKYRTESLKVVELYEKFCERLKGYSSVYSYLDIDYEIFCYVIEDL